MNLDQQQVFATELDNVAFELYSKEEWDRVSSDYERVGISNEFNSMNEHVHDVLFERKPELYENIQWINDECGCPLWVRPGVEWIPDHLQHDY